MSLVFDRIILNLLNEIIFPNVEGIVKDILDKVDLRSSLSRDEFISILE